MGTEVGCVVAITADREEGGAGESAFMRLLTISQTAAVGNVGFWDWIEKERQVYGAVHSFVLVVVVVVVVVARSESDPDTTRCDHFVGD